MSKKKKSKSLWSRIQQNLGTEATQKSFGTFLESLFKLNPEFAKLHGKKQTQDDVQRNRRYLQ